MRQRDEYKMQQNREEEIKQMSPDEQQHYQDEEDSLQEESHHEQQIEEESPSPQQQQQLSLEEPEEGVAQAYPEDPNPNEGEDGNPLLFVDVNLGPGRAERIVVYEGDTAEQLADEFTMRHGLDQNLRGRLVGLLQDQIAGLLARIDEEMSSQSENQEQEHVEIEGAH